jgi:hypothetical protein
MQPNLTAQANQAAAQGQQQLTNYNNQAASSTGDYNTYKGQADAANQQVNDYSQYMAGAGSGTNLYNTALTGQEQQLGYDPSQMTAARGNLNQSQGALSAYSDFANTGAAKFGLNAGGFAAANSGALSGINNNIAAQQGVVNGLSDIYKTAQTGANQSAGLGVQGEQNTLAGYQNVYSNAANQRDQAAQMMQFYNDLAQKQGGMNAQQAQYYAQAQQAYAASSQAMAQAALLGKQATAAQQGIDQTSAYMNSPAYQAYLGGGSSAPKNSGVGVIAPGHTGITGANGSVVGVK